jgi:AcrR family transcriptional regulator
MDPRARAVKRKLLLRLSRRQSRPANRNKIIDAAERRFLRDGYGPTTIAAIADDAGVHADTVYKGFGGKPGLVRAIRTRALQGEGPVPAEQRSDDLQAREPDGRRIIEGWGALTVEVAPRVAPVLLLIRAAAAGDPEVAALLEEMDVDRLRRMAANARRLRDAGTASRRHGRARRRAADVQRTRALRAAVPRRGWAPPRFGRSPTRRST